MKKTIFLLTVFLMCTSALQAADIKYPNVAGGFYPADKQKLSSLIDKFLEKAKIEDEKKDIFALIVPHAGYIYSGEVAAYSFKAIEGKKIDAVIVIGLSHSTNIDGVAVYEKGFFRTPLGDIAIDEDLAKALTSKDERIFFYPEVFEREHSIEVELPFLQKVLTDFKIVPVLVGSCSYQNAEMLANALSDLIKENKSKKILLVASVDLSHYHSHDQAKVLDDRVAQLVQSLDPKTLYEDIVIGDAEACNSTGLLSVLICAKKLGYTDIKILKRADSGDVTGDKTKVVGYLSAVIYAEDGSRRTEDPAPVTSLRYWAGGRQAAENESQKIENKKSHDQGEKFMLTKEQKKKLLEIAKQSIKNYITTGERTTLDETDPALTRKSGAFVTLKEFGNLRGCIGHIIADEPLCEVIADMAIEAATGDPRFSQVRLNEINLLDIEISVLSPLEKINDPNLIEPGKHGIVIKKGFHSGLLLPQVATEYGWDRKTFLEHTCNKAGLDKDAWKSGAEIYIFSAEVFSEADVSD